MERPAEGGFSARRACGIAADEREHHEQVRGKHHAQTEEPGSAALARQLVAEGERPFAIVIPADFSSQLDAGQKTSIEVVADPALNEQFAGPFLGMLQGIVERQIAQARFGALASADSGGGVELVRSTPPGMPARVQPSSAERRRPRPASA